MRVGPSACFEVKEVVGKGGLDLFKLALDQHPSLRDRIIRVVDTHKKGVELSKVRKREAEERQRTALEATRREEERQRRKQEEARELRLREARRA
jgi:hypothetical protein